MMRLGRRASLLAALFEAQQAFRAAMRKRTQN